MVTVVTCSFIASTSHHGGIVPTLQKHQGTLQVQAVRGLVLMSFYITLPSDALVCVKRRLGLDPNNDSPILAAEANLSEIHIPSDHPVNPKWLTIDTCRGDQVDLSAFLRKYVRSLNTHYTNVPNSYQICIDDKPPASGELIATFNYEYEVEV